MVNWLWGYTTVGINVDKVKAALGGTPMPDNVWDLVFKPEYISKLKSCGVCFLDSATEIIPAALHYLGKTAVQQQPGRLHRRRAAAQGSAPLRDAVQFVGLHQRHGQRLDLRRARLVGRHQHRAPARHRRQDRPEASRRCCPKTGGLLFFDMMVIPADAPHPGNAHKFINYIMQPGGRTRA